MNSSSRGPFARGAAAVFGLLLCAVAGTAQQPNSSHRWTLLEQDDPKTGKPFRELILSSQVASPSQTVSSVSTVLHLPCTSVSTAVIIASDAVFPVHDQSHPTFQIVIGDAPPIYQIWANLSPHRILLYDLRDRLAGHTNLTLSLPSDPPSATATVFDLSDLASAMQRENCRRRLQSGADLRRPPH